MAVYEGCLHLRNVDVMDDHGLSDGTRSENERSEMLKVDGR